MSAAAFFKEFIRNRKTIGAVAPSSPALARRIAEAAGVWEARHVLELGPGTGALTAAIADSMPHGSTYLGIELNSGFIERLRLRFPTLQFANAAAQEFDFDAIMAPDERFDVIVSGLPWASFPPGLQTAILDRVLPRLAPGGRFATFAYWGFHKLPAGRRFRALLHQRLHGAETTRVVWGNVPPAFVYVARA
jgi:phosphatidylethanolamine/phosphatidyl-N-methylethanolamine N-methyltransferase